MKRFGVTALVMCSFISSAFGETGYWKEINKTSEVGATPYGVKKLLVDFRYANLFQQLKDSALANILSGEGPSVIERITITTYFLEWQGDTICQPNDSRLKVQTLGYTACWAGSNGCEGSSSSILNRDPCLP